VSLEGQEIDGVYEPRAIPGRFDVQERRCRLRITASSAVQWYRIIAALTIVDGDIGIRSIAYAAAATPSITLEIAFFNSQGLDKGNDERVNFTVLFFPLQSCISLKRQ